MVFSLYSEDTSTTVKSLYLLSAPFLSILILLYYMGLFEPWTSYFLGQLTIIDYIRHSIYPLLISLVIYLFVFSFPIAFIADTESKYIQPIVFHATSTLIVLIFYFAFTVSPNLGHIVIGLLWIALMVTVRVKKIPQPRKITATICISFILCCFFSYQVGFFKQQKMISGDNYLSIKKELNSELWNNVNIKSDLLKYFTHLGDKTYFITGDNKLLILNDKYLDAIIYTKGE